MSLNERQKRFVLEYLADPRRCATDAAIRAGYGAKNAKFAGSRLMQHADVQRAIQNRLQNIVEKLEVNAEMVVRGIVESIEEAKGCGAGAWQMQAIQRGYELLGRYLGIFHEKVDVTSDDRLMASLMAGRRRAAGLEPESNEELEEEEPKPN